jgi:hypothetical protein
MCEVKESYGIRKLSSEVFDPLVASPITLNARGSRMGTLRLKRSQSLTTLEIHSLSLSYRTATGGKKLLRTQGFMNTTFDLEQVVVTDISSDMLLGISWLRDIPRRSSLTLLVYITHGRSTIAWP